MITCDPRLYAYTISNEPLPDHLRGSLNTFLEQLDAQWEVYEQDRIQVVQAISSRQSRVGVVVGEAEALRRIKEIVIKGQMVLRARRKGYANIATAFRRIPPEVIAKIIHFAVHGTHGEVHRKQRRYFANIRAVCQLWRKTSFSTPSLWRAIGVDIEHLYNRHSHTTVKTRTPLWRKLSSWFSRAGEGAPVKLFVHRPTTTAVSDCLDFACESGFNLGVLGFRASDRTGKQPPSLLPYAALKTLENPLCKPLAVRHLAVEFRHQCHLPSSGEAINLTQNFPDLSSFTLMKAQPPPITFPVKFVHGTLTKLYLYRMHLDCMAIYSLLSGLPLLEKLHLGSCTSNHADSFQISSVHTSLRTLIISCTLPEACFEGLTCPSLKEVRLKALRGSD
ncbi:hypothetical protein BKA70DRAFT_1352796 [Coprinopsis sp. MPI-PUGE-AT-0042]|nr:hypothetical protein BKA70DRAFT_1352796 [Coprinopsis sp. MPI-PUGE-AT-0042]